MATDDKYKFVTQDGDWMLSQCTVCARMQPGTRCTAYLEQDIPDAIMDNAVDHRKPYKGDGGLLFQASIGMDGKEFGHPLDTPLMRKYISEGRSTSIEAD